MTDIFGRTFSLHSSFRKTFSDDNYFGRYQGNFRPVKDPWQKKAGKSRRNCLGQELAGKTKDHMSAKLSAGWTQRYSICSDTEDSDTVLTANG